MRDFLDRLYAAERALLDRVLPDRDVEHAPRAHHHPSYRLRGDRADGAGKYWAPNYRQPIVPLTSPGILKRYELIGSTPVLATTAPTFAVPSGFTWRLQSMRGVLQTDATAADRTISLSVQPDGGTNATTVFISETSVIQIATQGVNHVWGAGLGGRLPQKTAAGPLQGQGGLPERLVLLESAHMQLFVAGAQAGDAWSSVEIYVEEWATVLR